MSDGGAFWDDFAARYDRFMRHLRPTYETIVAEILRLCRSDMLVLEIASGTGLIALRVGPHVRRVVGIDSSRAMVEEARAKAAASGPANVVFEVADGASTGGDGGYFHLVILCNALHVMDDPRSVLGEAGRVLAASGKLVVATYCHGEGLLSRTFSALMSLSGFRARHRWSVAGLRSFLETQGFAVERERVIRGPVPLLYAELTKRMS